MNLLKVFGLLPDVVTICSVSQQAISSHLQAFGNTGTAND